MTYQLNKKTWSDYKAFDPSHIVNKDVDYKLLPDPNDTVKKTRVYSNGGGRVNVGKYLTGNPRYMRKTTRRAVANAAYCYKFTGNNNGGARVINQIKQDMIAKIKAGVNPAASRIFVTGVDRDKTVITMLELTGATYKEIANIDAEKMSCFLSYSTCDELRVKSCPRNDDETVYRMVGYREKQC